MVPKPGWWSANINTAKLEACPHPAACSYPTRATLIQKLREKERKKELSQFGKKAEPGKASGENAVVAPAMGPEESHGRRLL